MLLPDLLTAARVARPDHIAIVDSTSRLSWRELDEAAAGAARWLHSVGVAPGDRVVYAGRSDHRFVIACFGALRVGAIFVPVHPDLTGPQLSYVADDSDARLVITDLHPIDSRPGRLVIDADAAATAAATSSWHLPDEPAPDPDAVALLIYTSGTTGHPKGVVCPHRQVLAATYAINDRLGYTADDVVLCRLPLSFDYGLYQLLLVAASAGTLVLADRAQDLALLKLIKTEGVTVVPLVPSLAQILTTLQTHRRQVTAVRLFTNTGARLGPETVSGLLAHFPAAAYASMYGMTECKRISILATHEFADHPTSVGRPIPGDTVRILDESGHELPAGVTGEIAVQGSTVMAGYWGVPLADQRRYVPVEGGLELRTGDQGYLDPDGRLYFVGRTDDIVKRHGIRVSLTEIEAAAEQIPGVCAAVAVKPTEEDGDLHLAVLAEIPAAVVRSELAVLVDRARLPTTVTAIEVVPLTPNGKPDRAAVGRLLATRRTRAQLTHHADPSDTEENRHEPVAV